MPHPVDTSPSKSCDPIFFRDVVQGLGRDQKQIHSKYFYDERGSQLFERICELDEYYLTRTELQIMELHAAEMADQLDAHVRLVEFGSGSGTKTRLLLEHLHEPTAFVPVDISTEHLHNTAEELRNLFPHIEILPLYADFTNDLRLPTPTQHSSHTAVYFPGSTIGNFTHTVVQQLLRRIANMVGDNGGLLIGIDLQKDVAVMEAAYNDSECVTAEFTLNLLQRVNSELGADFQIDQFQHKAVYNEEHARIETFIVSEVEQSVTIGEHEFAFAEDEHLLAEYSHKYTVEGFAEMAATAGLVLHRSWTDENQLFAVLHLVNEH